ncbi:MAG: histidinol-phosphate transaminase [Proteobacteria bacterium]|nr:histidinol-phosphate transaminase [Pseudomonadota bacterium]
MSKPNKAGPRLRIALSTLEKIEPYKPGVSRIEGVANPMKLSSNENPFGPSPKAIKAVEKSTLKMHRYPEGSSKVLRDALAEKHGIDAERIVCGAGSDNILELLCQAYAGVGDEVLYSEHGFLIYPIAALRVGATPVKAPEKNLTTDVSALLKAVTDKTKIVFIANPNNPTGSYLTRGEVKMLRDKLPPHILLVIDCAYAEYVTEKDYTTGLELVAETENTAVTFTFSKIYGLASLRVGWGYLPTAVVDYVNRIRSPFNVSEQGQVAAVAALKDNEFVKKSREHNTKWRDWLTHELSKLGIKVNPSQGNFILAEFPSDKRRNADSANSFLQSRGIIVRAVKGYGLPDHLRISIGLEEEVRAVQEALEEFMKR